jgi:8-oxo-dGTP diphosphatase
MERKRFGRSAVIGFSPVKAAFSLPHGATWCRLSQLGKLAYDHNEIVAAALARPREQLHGATIARFLMAPNFTLSHLQSAYEGVLGRPLDKRNFRKKLIESHIVRASGKKSAHNSVGPASFIASPGPD